MKSNAWESFLFHRSQIHWRQLAAQSEGQERCTSQEPDLIADLDDLLRFLCEHWAFCNRLAARDLMEPGASLSSTAFAIAVLRAEGFRNPQYEKQWIRKIGELFEARFGTSVSPETYVLVDLVDPTHPANPKRPPP